MTSLDSPATHTVDSSAIQPRVANRLRRPDTHRPRAVRGSPGFRRQRRAAIHQLAHFPHPCRHVERPRRLRRPGLGRPAGLYRFRRVRDNLLTQQGVQPYLAMILAAVASAPLAAILSLLVLRLRGGQFAVGTWVVAEAIALLVALHQELGGGTGISLRGLNVYPRETRTSVHILADARLRGPAALSPLPVASQPHRRCAPGHSRRRRSRSFPGSPGRAVEVCPVCAGRLRLRRRRSDDPGQHPFHPAAVDLRRAMVGLPDLHGVGRWTRHVRRADHRRDPILRDPVRVRRSGRLVPDRPRSGRRHFRTLPAARSVEPDQRQVAHSLIARRIPSDPTQPKSCSIGRRPKIRGKPQIQQMTQTKDFGVIRCKNASGTKM